MKVTYPLKSPLIDFNERMLPILLPRCSRPSSVNVPLLFASQFLILKATYDAKSRSRDCKLKSLLRPSPIFFLPSSLSPSHLFTSQQSRTIKLKTVKNKEQWIVRSWVFAKYPGKTPDLHPKSETCFEVNNLMSKQKLTRWSEDWEILISSVSGDLQSDSSGTLFDGVYRWKRSINLIQ